MFIIRGRNDQGKSTLIQMIGLGLYGRKIEDPKEDLGIDWSLRERMKYLVAEDTEKCEIDYTIVSRDDQIKIRAKVEGKEIRTYVNDTPKGFDYLNDNFKLIYDIPDEPVEKLKTSLRLLRDRFDDYNDYIISCRDKVEAIIQERVEYEEKEQRLQQIQTTIKTLNEKISQVTAEKEELVRQTEEKWKAHIAYTYVNLDEHCGNLDHAIEDLEARKKRLKRGTSFLDTTKYTKALTAFISQKNKAKSQIRSSQNLEPFIDVEKKEYIRNALRDIEKITTPDDLPLEQLREWCAFFEQVDAILEQHPQSSIEPKESREIEFLNNLLEFLDSYSADIDLEVPATNGKTIDQFRDELSSTIEQKSVAIKDKLELEHAKKTCNEILQGLYDLEDRRGKVEVDGTIQETYNLVSDDLEGKQQEQAKCVQEMVKIEEEFKSMPADRIDDYYAQGFGALSEHQRITQKIDRFEKNIKDQEINLGTQEQLARDAERLEKPRERDLQKLRELLNVLGALLEKSDRWRDYVKALVNDINAYKETQDAMAREFCDALGYYFAAIVGEIYARQRRWKVEQINFLEGHYVVADHEPFSFAAIGAGHTTLIALMTSLKQPAPGKKKIVLFDEIGLMDKNNRTILMKEIDRQIKSGDVLFALLTQVDDDLQKPRLQSIHCE
jgi:predicted lipoprotein with Yx(FWY)xxD motif